jgi:hypothetical protein
VISRWARFVAGSYPPVISVLFAFAWAYGVTGLFAAVQPHSPSWRPGVGTAVSAVTLTVTLLLMRAVDDIRDLDYDRRFNPKRPLASGAVHTRDLLVLCAAGSVLVLAINIGNPAALVVLTVQLAYCMVVLAVDQWLRWPSGDNLLLSLLVSFPAQLLLHIYLYVRYLDSTALTAHRGGVLAIVITVLATVHLEFAKKINRRLKPGERSYIEVFGFNGTVGIALTAPLASVVLLLAGARTTAALVPLAVLPLAMPAMAAWRFWRTPTTTRWPPAAPALYVLLTFACYFVLSLSYT